MYITKDEQYIRFDSASEIPAYFPNDGFTKNKQKFMYPFTMAKIKSFPAFVMLKWNGPDAATVGYDKEYVIIDVNELRNMRADVTAALHELDQLLKI